MSGPHHLAKFNTTIDKDFLSSEEIYRRCPFGNRIPPYSVLDFFIDIQWDKDLIQGLSVNRSKFARPEDALWSTLSVDNEKKICEYQEKEGIVYSSNVNLYPAEDLKTGVKFKLLHSPILCNISHCDIVVENIPNQINKLKKREVKAFLATFFQNIPVTHTDNASENDRVSEIQKRDGVSQDPKLRSGCLSLLAFFCFILLLLSIINNF